MAAPLAELMTLRFVKQVTVEFCPWERNVQSARQFLSYLGNSTMRRTNPKCIIKTNVKHDGTPPTVHVNFADGQNLLFKTSHLTLSELAQKFAEVNEVKLKEEAAAS
ncbi:large ribosomal subunit protein mL53-like [Diadema antillarum]|uniref:large ribosomal subunit protein mL53-like n=1 Tax=Diadema antillarum TaxID=105358 RepID=UPI003A867672